jgi:hypothetical protein
MLSSAWSRHCKEKTQLDEKKKGKEKGKESYHTRTLRRVSREQRRCDTQQLVNFSKAVEKDSKYMNLNCLLTETRCKKNESQKRCFPMVGWTRLYSRLLIKAVDQVMTAVRTLHVHLKRFGGHQSTMVLMAHVHAAEVFIN